MVQSKLGQKAKETLEEFAPIVGKKVEEYFAWEMANDFGVSRKQKKIVRQMLGHLREFALRPQKRLRGSLVYYSYLLGDGEVTSGVWDAIVGMELINVALLILDDFMDKDERRRGGVTMHKIYEKLLGNDHLGAAMAVTMGDEMLCLGFDLVARSGNAQATSQVLRGVAQTAYGQAYDLILTANQDWEQDDVLAMHAAKTATYTYQNPLLVGAYLAGLKEEVLKLLADYGVDAGVAFQLQDDILGVYGTPEKTGKSSDSDLKQGKCTLMVLKTYELGKTHQQAAVRKVWGNVQASREELDLAKAAMRDCGAYEYNKKLARDYAKKAFETAGRLRQFKLNEQAIAYIQGIAEYMAEREV